MCPKELMSFMKEAVKEFFVDNCTQLAAAVSFFLLFSLFPLALVAISVTGFILKSPTAQEQLISGIGDLIPISSTFITSTITGVVSARGTLGIFAIIGLLVGGLSVFYSVSKSLNAAWGIHQPRTFLRERLVDFCMMVGAGLLLLISISLTAGFRVVGQLNLPAWGSMFLTNVLFWHCLVFFISAVLTFVVFLFLYRFVPNTPVRWRDIWGGALAAAICFEGTKFFFLWFVGNFGRYNLIYGPIGALIALLMWTYVSAVIFLFCAKLTSVYARRRTA